MQTREATLRFLVQTTDANLYGNMHGGIVMKWIDEAGFVAAAGWCGKPCVTVYVGGIQFHKPVPIGSLVQAKARVIYTGHTSIHCTVSVSAREPFGGNYVETTECIIVFVALDSKGKPTPVPKWIPQTEEDKALEQFAIRWKEYRKKSEADIDNELKAIHKSAGSN
jgi:acyl-CoA hydrolase